MAGPINNSATASKPRRILMTADTVGGVWTYALELAHALSDHGIDVALATMGGRLKREQRKEVKQVPHVQIYESSFKLEWMDEPWTDVEQAGSWLLEIERRVQPDLVHLNNFAHGGLPWSAPTVMVGHSCMLSWWKAVKQETAPASWEKYRAVVREGLQSANAIVAPSRAMMQSLKEFYGPFSTTKVIYNARNPSLFHTRPKEEVILTAGRLWDEAKNVPLLTKVAHDIPWTIYIAGEDRHPSGRPDKTFKSLCPLGKLPTPLLAQWFARAAIYVAPALYEPFGLSILEAALSGCALVLSDIPSLRENWNRAALFVSPNDPEQLKQTLQQLIENPFRRKELAAFAQCRAIQFNPKHMAGEYMALYADVLAKYRANKRRPIASSDVLSHAAV